MKTLCPRCDSETLDLGVLNIEFKNKKMKVSCRLCPKCKLIFYEALS
jgi:ssDNA-binding Zn-finger/Zn-ribbon topoisomerase 1